MRSNWDDAVSLLGYAVRRHQLALRTDRDSLARATIQTNTYLVG